MSVTALILALAPVFVVILWTLHRRHRAAVKAERTAMFDPCLPRFECYAIEQDDLDFPVLSGRYRGYDVTVEPLADHVGYRKLPILWLLVTVKKTLPYAGIFDFLVRPQNIEFFSPFSRLGQAIAVPEGWPEHAGIRTDQAAGMPPLERLAPHIGLFADPKAKELLVTPRGVRIVYQANQAQRREYLVLRAVTFENLAPAPALVFGLLDRAIAVHQDLAQERAHEAALP